MSLLVFSWFYHHLSSDRPSQDSVGTIKSTQYACITSALRGSFLCYRTVPYVFPVFSILATENTN
jgi:hypothetical protein